MLKNVMLAIAVLGFTVGAVASATGNYESAVCQFLGAIFILLLSKETES